MRPLGPSVAPAGPPKQLEPHRPEDEIPEPRAQDGRQSPVVAERLAGPNQRVVDEGDEDREAERDREAAASIAERERDADQDDDRVRERERDFQVELDEILLHPAPRLVEPVDVVAERPVREPFRILLTLREIFRLLPQPGYRQLRELRGLLAVLPEP